MTKMKFAAALIAALTLSSAAYAASSENANGNKSNPKSSAAATPGSKKHSAGTVGAMNNAESGSFTASKSAQKKVHLEKTK